MSAMQATNGRTQDAVIERVIALGDLKELTPRERTSYYRAVCESMGLNPLTQPFAYIVLNNKLTLYAKRDTTDQLRKIHNVSVTIASRDKVDDLFVVVARATTPDGRTDESTGAVNLAGLKGENLANAIMKAETKAKRRVTLSICGLGWLDETEVSDVRGAKPVTVTADGEVVEPPQPDLAKQLAASVEQNWPKWSQNAMAYLREAAKSGMGALQEAWAEVYAEMSKLDPPAEVRAVVTEAKDELKESLRGAQ